VGFGALTIAKSITVNCHDRARLRAGVRDHAIIINAGAADRVVLRNIQILGLNTGLAGVKILRQDRCSIETASSRNSTQQGILDAGTQCGGKCLQGPVVSLTLGAGISVAGATHHNATPHGVRSSQRVSGVACRQTGNNVTRQRSISSNGSGAWLTADRNQRDSSAKSAAIRQA